MTYVSKTEKIAAVIEGAASAARSQASTSGNIYGPLERLKRGLKKNGRFYYFLLRLLGPVFIHPRNQALTNQILASYGGDSVILNVGSGPSRFNGREDILNLDIFPYEEVDIVCDGQTLPVKSGVADLVISVASLEHIADPLSTVAEMYRVAKPNGRVFIFVPFMQPFHAAPDDFTRWTASGVRNLVRPFVVETVMVGGGPTSGFLWVMQEWIAILLSFGSRTLAQIIFLGLSLVTWPLKWLDLVLIYHPDAEKVASGFYVVARKPG